MSNYTQFDHATITVFTAISRINKMWNLDSISRIEMEMLGMLIAWDPIGCPDVTRKMNALSDDLSNAVSQRKTQVKKRQML